jgi:hypothetical protein
MIDSPRYRQRNVDHKARMEWLREKRACEREAMESAERQKAEAERIVRSRMLQPQYLIKPRKAVKL